MHSVRHAPLDPSTTDLHGRALRHAALAVLLRAIGPLTIGEVQRGIESYGRRIDAAYPLKALADGLGYEARQGRVRRVSRGRYGIGRVSRGMRYRVLTRFGIPASRSR